MAMPSDQNRDSAPDERIQCHVVPNTHWDREWKYSFPRMQYMLVEMVDLLLDVLEKAPEIKTFHFDSQTAPMLDYLQIRPEREDDLRKFVQAGRLDVGPWYTLPDEFCVGGESLIRNLLLGHRVARRFGRVCKSGYSPFSWGQISQIPQIYQGFGIDVMMFYRGVNTKVAPRSEFIWEGADGTRIIASRLAARPRYNAWYVLQRPAYWGTKLDALNDFELPWSCGYAPFRIVDSTHSTLDYKLAHPRYDYDASVIKEASQQAIREQDADWSTSHRLWAIGHDASYPDLREVQLIADAKEAIRDRADVFFSSIEEFQNGIRASKRDDWPVVSGEMRHTFTTGSSSSLLGWIISARSYLKQDNFCTERALIQQAEPMAIFAALLGVPFPRAFINKALELLIQNHAHDSIGGCGRDIVHDEMQSRFRRVREFSTCILEQAMMEIAGSVDTSCWSTDDLALVVHNLTSRVRDDVMTVALDVPVDWESFEIVSPYGAEIPTQQIGVIKSFQESVHNPHDVSTFLTSNRHTVILQLSQLPPMGYTTYRIRQSTKKDSATRKCEGMVVGQNRMANEFVEVLINPNGTLRITDKATGYVTDGLGYFIDSGASGNPWQHEAPAHDSVFTTLDSAAIITLVREGPLETSFQVRHNWDLPESLSEDGASRSKQLRTVQLVNTVTLRRGQSWVEVVTEFENTIKDHYLRICFQTGLQTDRVCAQSSFDVVEREIALPHYEKPDEPPQPEQPMDSFVDMSDGRFGLAILNEGLKAYEACDDDERTINLTLIRSLAMRFFVPDKFDHEGLSDGSQCPGRHQFRYAIMPHKGNWEVGDVWQAAEQFNSPLVAGQIGMSSHGREALTKSFLEITPTDCCLSAVKRNERDNGFIVRVFNPTSRILDCGLRFNGSLAAPPPIKDPMDRHRAEFRLPESTGRKWSSVKSVSLEEEPLEDLEADAEGWVQFTLDPRKIFTVEFIP